MINVTIGKCTGFEWDEWNSVKNWHKHTVSQAECEEVFFNLPLIIASDEKHSQQETRYYGLGMTDEKRLIFVVFTIRKNHIRIISARPMSKKEKIIYERQIAEF